MMATRATLYLFKIFSLEALYVLYILMRETPHVRLIGCILC